MAKADAANNEQTKSKRSCFYPNGLEKQDTEHHTERPRDIMMAPNYKRGKQEYIKNAGSIIKVRGTDTK